MGKYGTGDKNNCTGSYLRKIEYDEIIRNTRRRLPGLRYYYNPEVRFLLVNQSEEKDEIFYNASPYPFKLPKIGPRPPYYVHPRYEPYYPLI